jgi:hypothetical protein
VRIVAGRWPRRSPHASTAQAEFHHGQCHQCSIGKGKVGGDFQGHGLLLFASAAAGTYKLVLVRTDNIGIRELKELFARNLPAIEQALKKHSLVELDRSEVRVLV